MALTLDTLSTEITNAYTASKFPVGELSKKFLPEGELERLVTQESIIRELDCQDDDPLVEFILKDAKKLFAISLVSYMQKLKPTMELFMKHKISDQDLPVPTSRDKFNSNLRQCFKLSHPLNVEIFMTQQWTFLAPVFSVGTASAGTLVTKTSEQGIIFPFTETEREFVGGVGTVYRVKIHRSHLGGIPDDPIVKVRELHGFDVVGIYQKPNPHPLQANYNAAIKELKVLFSMDETQSSAYKAWQKEVTMLRRVSLDRNPHIIEVNAVMSRGGKQYIMFPWADGGNLADFWRRNPSPILTVDFIRDIVEQLAGLADALNLLHSLKYRHGNLKPENILIFTSEERQGLWKMADIGLAKFHQEATQQRLQTISSNYSGTISYEPPETATRYGPRSRVYDVWCMGCITLQLIIWMLRGLEAHDEFIRNIRDISTCKSSFWTNIEQPQLHPKVTRVMDDLSQTLKDETESRALEALLDIVRSKLLVVRLESRAHAGVFHSELKNILKKHQANKEYWFADRNLTNLPHDTKPLESHSSMDTSSQAGNANDVALIEREVATGADEKVQHEDLWDFITDNNFAGELFGNGGVLSSVTISSSTVSLCGKCRQMKISDQPFQITDSTLDLEQQSRLCDFCNMRWNLCKDLDPGKQSTVIFDKLHSTLRLNRGSPPVMTLHRGPDRKSTADAYMRQLQIGFPQLPVAGSGTYYEILRQWLRDCDRNHTDCENPNIFRFPTRLIDVGTSSSPALRLYETRRGDSMNYFALSHPWGKEPHFCTSPENLDEYRQGINFDDLPTTFQNAVTVTRELQLRYLWIDSICIIQGPKGDFYQEAKLMEDIFSRAYCVLAASSAVGQADGFIKPRRQRKCITFQQDGQDLHVCEFIDDFDQHVLKSPLNQRGWVLQERVLARRIIYFTDMQTYWDCRRGVRCETMMKMKNTFASFFRDPAFPKVAIESPYGPNILLYQNLYSQYSRLGLTHPEDRPVAIAGLEKRLIQSFRVSGGFGILDDTKHGLLRQSLLWHRAWDFDKLKKINFQCVASLAPRASSPPTWSWMSYKGAIEYLDMKFGQVEWEAEEIRSPWSDSAMGTWSYSRDESDNTLELRVIARELEVPAGGLGKDMRIILDDPTNADVLGTALRCVVLGRLKSEEKPLSDRTHFVLLVTVDVSQVARGHQVYTRVGVGSMPGSWISLNKPGTSGRVR